MLKKHRFTLALLLALLPFSPANASSFPVSRFVIEGNTLLASERLEAPLASLLGAERTIDDLLEARTRIENLYREAGYGLVSVGLPRSIDADGTVRLQVRELRLNSVAITPADENTPRHRAALPSLRENESPNLLQLARELNLANENPGRSITVDFAQQDDGIGAAVKVEATAPLKLALTLDNTGSPATGRYRSGLVVHHANVFDRDHQLSFAYTTAPDHLGEVTVVGLNYRIPLPTLGDSVVFAANYSDVDSGQVADFFNVSGQGYGYGAHYIRNLTRGANRRAALDFGIDRRVYRDVIDFSGFDLGTRVSSRALSVLFSTSGRVDRHSVAATLGAARNLPGDSLNDDLAYANARAGATADWSVARASARWSLLLPGNSQLSLRAELQHTEKPLISGEQFGLGGSRSVRGLEERETAGDRGALVTLEWTTATWREQHRLALFADAGQVTRLNSPDAPDESAASWGVGWRFGGWQGLNVSLDLARVRDGGGRTEKNKQRGHFAAAWSF